MFFRPRKPRLLPGIRRRFASRWRPWQTNEWSWKNHNRPYRIKQRSKWKWGPTGPFRHLSKVDRKWARKAHENPVPRKLTRRGRQLRSERSWAEAGIGVSVRSGPFRFYFRR